MDVGRNAPLLLGLEAGAPIQRLASPMMLALALALCPGAAPAVPLAPDRDAPTEEHVDLVEPARERRDFQMRWFADQRFTAGADFGDSDADEQRYRTGVRVTRRISPDLAIRVSANWEASLYDFDGATDLISGTPQSGDPFDTLYQTELVMAAVYRIGWGWSLAGGGLGRSSLESGADFADSLVGGGFLAVAYELTEWLEMGAGVQVRSRLRDNGVTVSPLYRLRWKISDAWRLETSGRGLRLRYKPSSELDFSLFGRVKSTRYRLDETGTPLGTGTLQV